MFYYRYHLNFQFVCINQKEQIDPKLKDICFLTANPEKAKQIGTIDKTTIKLMLNINKIIEQLKNKSHATINKLEC